MSNSEWDYYGGYSGWGEWVPRLPATTSAEDVTKFKFSAKSFLLPVSEIEQLLHSIAERNGFAEQLKKAAELNQSTKVNNLIRSTGVKTQFATSLNPDGIRIIFQPESVDACFQITLSLCW